MNRPQTTRAGRLASGLAAFALTLSAFAATQLNEDGQAVVRLAGDEYSRIVAETPVISDKTLNDYVRGVARGLLPRGESLPKGMRLQVALLDKPMPEVYSLANGTLMLTSGALLALENEAQLAAVLSHELAHLVAAHYPAIYQAFKEQERRQRSQLLAAGIAGVVLDQAIEYSINVAVDDVYADADRGNISYHEAIKRITAIEAGAGAIEGFKDVYQSLPPETRAGSGDPRLPLEMVADAEGLQLLARAGYDPTQAGEAWRRLRKQADKVREGSMEALSMAFLPPEMRSLITGVEGPMGGIRAERLTRSISQNPPDRPAFLDALARSKEIRALGKAKPRLGEAPFRQAIGAYVLVDAREAYDEGDWGRARDLYQNAWDAGFHNAEVALRLGQSQLGGFAFAASEREKEAAEGYLLKAVELDPKLAEPYKALGELYGEWDQYERAAEMYRKYLKAEPKARDRARIERAIKKMERKARR